MTSQRATARGLRTVVHNGGMGEDLYAFGNRQGPREVRAGIDIHVDSNGMVRGQHTPQQPSDQAPQGASTFVDPDQSGLTGHFHLLPAGTRLPNGLDIYADGADAGGSAPWGHRTIYPTRDMSLRDFQRLLKTLPWQYGGKV